MKNTLNKLRQLLWIAGSCLIGEMAAQQLIPQPKEMTVRADGKVTLQHVDAKVNPQLKLPDEGYTIDIKGTTAVVRAKTEQGLVWARQTLRQLEDADGRLPQVTIKDYPAFPLRGFMHDTGRNFRPVDMLLKEIDLFSFYKLNAFHWHLSDNPAWRIECKAYPQLNDPQYQRKGRDEGKFYTYDEIRAVIAYAKERGVTVIPEIDMPGHSKFFDTTFGFSMASDEGMKVLKVCLEEFFHEIPAADCPYFHIGSDEVHVRNPKAFMKFCEDLVRANGRIPIAWDPGLEPSDETIGQIWYASIGEKLEQGETYPRRFIDSYQGYLNIGSPILNVTKYFQHTPCGVPAANAQALGGILCLWNDVRVADKSLTFPQNGMPNDLLAFAERYWCGGKLLSIQEEDLVPTEDTEVYRSLLDFEQRLSYHRDRFLYDWDMRWVANASIPWQVTLPRRRGTSVEKMEWQPARGGVVDMLAFCRRHGVKVHPTMDAWMQTDIYVEQDTTLTAWLGFDSPGRASKMSDGIGYQGQWEAQGRLFVNDTEVFPRDPWKEPGRYRFHQHTWHQAPEEVPYTPEQFCWLRQPAYVPLHKGWNRIRLYCPRVFPGEVWQVTFLPVSIDANGHVSEVKGLVYRRPSE